MAEYEDFNDKIIAEFRANAGKVGGPFQGAPVLLLHHTGAKSGTERVNPLMYQQVGDSYAIFASKGGAPSNPDWYYNLVAHPEARPSKWAPTDQGQGAGGEPDEREPIWNKQKETVPGFAEYETNAAPRVIPVVCSTPEA